MWWLVIPCNVATVAYLGQDPCQDRKAYLPYLLFQKKRQEFLAVTSRKIPFVFTRHMDKLFWHRLFPPLGSRRFTKSFILGSIQWLYFIPVSWLYSFRLGLIIVIQKARTFFVCIYIHATKEFNTSICKQIVLNL